MSSGTYRRTRRSGLTIVYQQSRAAAALSGSSRFEICRKLGPISEEKKARAHWDRASRVSHEAEDAYGEPPPPLCHLETPMLPNVVPGLGRALGPRVPPAAVETLRGTFALRASNPPIKKL